MDAERRFCRFTRGNDRFSIHEIPKDGFCLSAFLLLSPPADPDRILVGRMNPGAPWGRLGGLNPDRVEAHRHGWVLPASQLLLEEAPVTAAHRILAEQLGGLRAVFDPPLVTSEVGAPKRFPQSHRHWDIGFLFRGRVAVDPLPPAPAWTELRFLDPRSLSRSEFARSHDEVLDLAGWPVGSKI